MDELHHVLPNRAALSCRGRQCASVVVPSGVSIQAHGGLPLKAAPQSAWSAAKAERGGGLSTGYNDRSFVDSRVTKAAQV